MTKVYIHFAKLKSESKPRVWAYLKKSDALEQKKDYDDINRRAKGHVIKNRIKVVNF